MVIGLGRSCDPTWPMRFLSRILARTFGKTALFPGVGVELISFKPGTVHPLLGNKIEMEESRAKSMS